MIVWLVRPRRGIFLCISASVEIEKSDGQIEKISYLFNVIKVKLKIRRTNQENESWKYYT